MEAFIIVICSVFALLAIWLAIRRAREFSRSVRAPRAYVPIPDPNPPARVVRTTGVVAVSAAGFTWAALHIVLGVAWVATGYLVKRTAISGLVVVYVCAAAIITAIGCVMLYQRERYGRRTIAMGQFLFALAAFMGAAVAMLFPRAKDIPSHWYKAAVYLVVAMGLHLLIDAVLGAAAQRVGVLLEDDDDEAAPGEQ